MTGSGHPRFYTRTVVAYSPSLNVSSYNQAIEDAARLLAQWASEACGGAGSGPAYDSLMSYSTQLREKLTITPVMLKSAQASQS